jgi:hypothetical protein
MPVKTLLLVMTLLVGACGSGSESDESGYDSVDEMRQIVEAEGFECTGWRPLTEVEPRDANDIATCTQSVVFSTHTGVAQVRVFVDRRAERLTSDGFESVALVGSNWSVNCDPAGCVELQEALGGEIEIATP